MNEGRAELQRVILQYEKQRAEAIRSKQEAEIVLPFVRAALEELDAALGQSETDAEGKRAQTKLAVERSAAAAKERAAEPPTFDADQYQSGKFEAVRKSAPAGSSVFGVDEDDYDQDEDSEPAPAKPSFGRSSIASLIDEAGKGKQKTG